MSSIRDPARPVPRPPTPAALATRGAPARTPPAVSVPSTPAPPGAIGAVAAAAVEDLGRLLVVEHTTTAVLQKIADAARATIPGVVEASVTLLEGPRVTSVAWTGLLAYELDEAQYHSGNGPCVEAARSGVARWVQDSRQDRRWPDYLRVAVGRGVLSSFSVPVPVPSVEGVRVGLNLYSTEVDGFSEAAREGAAVFVARAAAAVANRHAYDLVVREVENLHRGLEGRAVIDQAKGVLMAVLGLSSEDAFAAMSHRSQTTNVKLQHLGAQLLIDVQAGVGQSAVEQFRAAPGQPVRPAADTP